MEETLKLYTESDAHGGTRHVWLRLTGEGALILEGQDLGGAVTEFYGEGLTEYEWDWALPPDRLHVLLEPLGMARDATLGEIGRRLQQLDRAELQRRFEEAGAEFWSRIGD